ncbi:MAG: acyl-CoA/acyl-ACP dehydrogenase [Deltaproteobacteria bacterium]|nr:MAG: acyl-CoA/acyl-ACP dehydrogenase [Deltaproteobacteria bacterium]
MNLDFSEEQVVLREMVRGLCAEYAPLEVVRKLEDDPIGYPTDFWKQQGELGLLGLTLPESYGGAQQTALDAAIVYEEFGRALAPSPHFVSSVLSGGALLAAGTEEQKKSWLPRIGSGEAILTPAWLEPGNGYGPRGVQVEAVADGGDFRLSGTKRHVLFASAADRLLVLARTGPGEADVDLFLVDPKAPGVDLTQQLSLASDTQYRVDFRDVRVPAADRVGAAGSGWAAWSDVMLDAIILLGAQAIGGADRALEMTVAYAKERKQFDKPLGAFQALAHYLADAATEVDGGRVLVYEAAWARSEGRPVDRLAPMAKLFACDTYRNLTAMAIQVHGGVGFTIEYDIQLYFRRAKQLQMSWWDARHLEERIASSVLDRPAS